MCSGKNVRIQVKRSLSFANPKALGIAFKKLQNSCIFVYNKEG